MSKRRILAIAATTVLALGAAGYGGYLFTTRAQGTPQAVEIDKAVLPTAVDGAAVTAIGEATHGTSEIYAARQVLTEKLITDHGYTAVALEADFGGGRVADDYVRDGVGTPEQAAAALGFRVYRNEEMASLLRMLREHNAALPPEQRVGFYGIDCQRADLNKQQLEEYLRPVAPDLADQVAQATAALTDDAAARPGATGKQTLPEVEAAFDALNQREADLVAATDEEAFRAAQQNLRVLVQNTQVSSARSSQGQSPRDTYMADNTTWVVDQQAGRGGVVLLAHNGHMSRIPTGAGNATWSGVLLTEKYQDRYVAIGTDMHAGRFAADPEVEGSVSVRQPYRGIFDGTRIGYVDLAEVSPQNRALLEEPAWMVAIGAEWSGWMGYLPFSHSFQVAPAKAYDALVYVQESTPTTPLAE